MVWRACEYSQWQRQHKRVESREFQMKGKGLLNNLNGSIRYDNSEWFFWMLKIEWFIYFHHKINLGKNGLHFDLKGKYHVKW